MNEPPASRMRVWTAGILLGLCTGAILAVTLRPRTVTEGNMDVVERVLDLGQSVLGQRSGVSMVFDYRALEFIANVAMYVPFGMLLALVLPARRVWVALPIVVAFSAALETVQALFLAARFGTVDDVIANTVGGAIGVALAVILRSLVHRRDRRILARARYRAQIGFSD